MNSDLLNSDSDKSQHMLNAIDPDSLVTIHRHRKSSETVVCICGGLVKGIAGIGNKRKTTTTTRRARMKANGMWQNI